MIQLIIFFGLVATTFAGPHDLFQRSMDGRIIGGEPVDIEQYPYQISLQFYGIRLCGGSIISPTFVVTAAHCTNAFIGSTLSVYAGSSYTNNSGILVNVAEVFEHPNFNIDTVDYDISILRLQTELVFSSSINQIELPQLNQEIEVGADAVVTGWGLLSEGGAPAYQLQAVTVQIIGKDVCDNAFPGAVTNQMVCAGVLEGGKDSCNGDSGGPLVIGGQLIGIVSWGNGCAQPGFPGVYGNVPILRQFISDTTGL